MTAATLGSMTAATLGGGALFGVGGSARLADGPGTCQVRALEADAQPALKRQALANLSLLLAADQERSKALGSGGRGAAALPSKAAIAEMNAAAEHGAAVTGALQVRRDRGLHSLSASVTCDGGQQTAARSSRSRFTDDLGEFHL
jgi:hypothetical protein